MRAKANTINNKRPTTFSFITGIPKEVRISVFRDLSYRLIAINEGPHAFYKGRNYSAKSKWPTYRTAPEHFAISLFTYLACFGPRLGSYIELADISSSGISPFSMPSAAVHCPERIRNGVRDRETDMLCQFEGFKPERERERGLTDHAKMKR